MQLIHIVVVLLLLFDIYPYSLLRLHFQHLISLYEVNDSLTLFHTNFLSIYLGLLVNNFVHVVFSITKDTHLVSVRIKLYLDGGQRYSIYRFICGHHRSCRGVYYTSWGNVRAGPSYTDCCRGNTVFRGGALSTRHGRGQRASMAASRKFRPRETRSHHLETRRAQAEPDDGCFHWMGR